jgi:hypothetical protein
MTDDLAPQPVPTGPDPADPTESAASAAQPAPARSHRPLDPRRRRAVVALPLVVAVVAAGALLWTRAEPTRRGDFCSRATVEAVRVVRASDGSVRVQYDQSTQVDDVLANATVVRLDQLIDGAPADLRKQLIAAEADLPAFRRELEEARKAGRTPPEPPAHLRDTALAFLATYLGTCVRPQS